MTTSHLVAVNAVSSLPTAAWDLKSFLSNAKDYTEVIGGSFLMLLGVIALIVGGTYLVMKLWGSQQSGQKHGWGQIIMLIIIGGALSSVGLNLMTTIGSGGNKTITDLGGGTAIIQQIDAPADALIPQG